MYNNFTISFRNLLERLVNMHAVLKYEVSQYTSYVKYTIIMQ